MSEASGGETTGIVPKELASLVPSFDPATDNVDIWTSKVELLLATWPTTKLNELATRLILGCKGTAYQKLQLLRNEVLTNDEKGIQRLVEIVGGTWGQIPLEKRFELAERALYRCTQKADETSDSYLSRCDVVWTEVLARQMTLAELQAYVILRGSKLLPEDKKRVIVETKESKDSELTMKSVTSAIRLLGSGFFQDYTGLKRDKNAKTYDHMAYHMDDDNEGEQETFLAHEELLEDDVLEALAAENDEDAILVMQFEDSISETIQADAELSAYYSSYQDARRRLSERVKVRGFWPVSRRFDKGQGKKGKGKGKGKFSFSGPGSLAKRIANSFCRICMQKGHWKNECPQKSNASSSQPSNNASASVAPTSFVVTEDDVPDEIAQFAVVDVQDHSSESACFHVGVDNVRWGLINRGKITGECNKFAKAFHTRWKHTLRTMKPSEKCRRAVPMPKQQPLVPDPIDAQILPEATCDAYFATTGATGIVDLGASQTVVGEHQVKELLSSLPEEIQHQVQRTSCHLTFRFGNQQTLTSRHALLLPLGRVKFRIAIVPGKTPFLLSSSFLKGIKAVIDTEKGTLWSRTLNKELQIHQSNKNLFLMDICQLWQNPEDEQQVQRSDQTGFTCQPVSDKNTVSSLSQRVAVDTQSPKMEAESETLNSDVATDVSQVSHEDHLKALPQPDKLNRSRVSPTPSHQCRVTQHVGHACESEVAAVSQEPAPRGSSRHCGENSHDAPRSVVQGKDCIRQSQERPIVSGGLQGRSLDRLVHPNLREEHQAGTPAVCAIRDQATGHGDQSRAQKGVSQGITSLPGGSERPSSSRLRSVGSGIRAGSLHRLRHAGDQQGPTDGRTSGQPEHREQESGIPYGGSGDGLAGGSSTSEGAECQERAIAGSIPINVSTDEGMPDLDYEFMSPNISNSFQAQISRNVKKFLLELQSVEQCLLNSDHRKLPRLDLLEVMCSEQSELTRQVQGLGGKAQRFGRVQGDLSTTEGRKRLFNILVTRKPKHVWISPECGPWCQWSFFNMTRSLECWEKVMEQRTEKLWQITLSIVLFRYQRQHRNHFDLEQPRGSALMKTPGMSEIREHTLWNEFDMCRVGNLKTPDSQEHLRKRMAVCSTSVDLHMALHGKLCQGDHHHRPIAGQTSSRKIHAVITVDGIVPSKVCQTGS